MQKHTLHALAGVVMTALALGLVTGPAAGRVLKGTKKGDRIAGTSRADTIRLGKGNDRARGRGGGDRVLGGAGRDVLSGNGGRDRLSGGHGGDRLGGGAGNDRLGGDSGNDRLSGGSGKDRLSGGAGNDVVNAVDRRRDARIDAGRGRNTCRLDLADLPVAKGCATIAIGKGRLGGAPGGSLPGSGAPGSGGGPGGTGGSGGSGGLALTSASGLSCGSQLPTCLFTLAGTGADALVGTVTGQGGVQPGLGANVSVSGTNWNALGTYGCTSDGYLRVTIGQEVLDVPVDCTV